MLLDIDRIKRLAEGQQELRIVLASIKLKAELLNIKTAQIEDSLGAYVDVMRRVADKAEALHEKKSLPLEQKSKE
jgi:hypothetical protein